MCDHMLLSASQLNLKLVLLLPDASVPHQKKSAAEQQSSHDDASHYENDAPDDDDNDSSLVLQGQARYLLCLVGFR